MSAGQLMINGSATFVGKSVSADGAMPFRVVFGPLLTLSSCTTLAIPIDVAPVFELAIL